MSATLRNLFLAVLLSLVGISASAQVTVISPNGGETWIDGNASLISWNNAGTEDYFIIEFSADNGNTWWEILYAYGYPGENEIFYTGYLEATTEAKIRISNYYNPQITDVSDGTFTVVIPDYYIYYPAQGSFYYQGQEIYVQWNSTNTNPVNIDLSTDNGSTWTEVASSITGYYYAFFAPEVVSDQCKIRLSDATDPTVSTVGNLFSIITSPTITVTAPNGGEVWEFGQYHTISWTGENLGGYVLIDISSDGGNTWQQQWWGESTPTGGTLEVVAPMIPTENARIRVSDYYYTAATDISDNDFTINSPAFIVYSPYAGSAYYTGQEILLQWTSYMQTNVNVEVSTDNGATYQTVLTDIPSYQQYLYIDAPAQSSDYCIFRLSVSDNPELFGLSEVFRVVDAPTVEITQPVAGDLLDNDSAYFIKWTVSGEILYNTYVQVDYSGDNGTTWTSLGWLWDLNSLDSLEWRTPLQTSDQSLIRFTDYYNELINVQSGVFSIKDIPTLEICMVSVDSASGKNMVIWNKVESELIAEYVILKESNVSNEYVEIGSVDPTAVSIFIDQNSDPAEKATRYKLTFRDQDGNLYGTGSLHQTIHLSINKGVGNNWNLNWNNYLGFPVTSYNIYRGTNPGDMILINTVSGNFTSYTDQNAPAGFIYYMVEVLNPNQCNPEGLRSGVFSSTKSNIATNRTLGFREGNELSGLTAYPNPATDLVKIKSDEMLKGDVTISVVSIYGQVVNSFSVDGTELTRGVELNTSGLSQGVYTIIIGNEQSNGIIRFIKQE